MDPLKKKRMIRVFIMTEKVGSRCEDEFEAPSNWDAMSELEKEAFCQEIAFNHVEWSWEELPDNETDH